MKKSCLYREVRRSRSGQQAPEESPEHGMGHHEMVG